MCIAVQVEWPYQVSVNGHKGTVKKRVLGERLLHTTIKLVDDLLDDDDNLIVVSVTQVPNSNTCISLSRFQPTIQIIHICITARFVVCTIPGTRSRTPVWLEKKYHSSKIEFPGLKSAICDHSRDCLDCVEHFDPFREILIPLLTSESLVNSMQLVNYVRMN